MDGEDKQYLMVMVPLGMRLKAGMRAALYPKDLWEQAQKNEKIDETKLKGLKLEYKHVPCRAAARPKWKRRRELINDLKTFGGMVVFAINPTRARPSSFPVPLAGFEKAYAGGRIDAQQYRGRRQALVQQIAQRQRELAEQQKKQAGSSPRQPPRPPPAAKK